MSQIEQALLRRWPGSRIILFSIVVGVASYLPLQLYIWFGPKDGNPIGLGLLAVAGVPVSALGILIGVVKAMVETVYRRRG